MPDIIGYHANEKIKCDEFIASLGKNLVISQDKQYLGDGMYFWDNSANAMYWKKQKERKRCFDSNVSILSCGIELENMLDLTDEEIIDFLEQQWNKLESHCPSEKIHNMGWRMNFLFANSPLMRKIHVVKAHVTYQTESARAGFWQDSYFSFSTRTIYCVKDSRAIKLPIAMI